ncbi:MAG: hypothetical protein HON53_14610 [Planctomycetaceae bacterium]|jgi:hypothetical protein|nr:hypothetical protein [Planctomycetaceae bacterium]MBT6156386.1 hypothetical protein [Planctomycetaceae bacterium]MBT6488000.1 hypothetical protein [Planctomycetaceae bacterium]MBT6495267.1 hypothetical protein [Planctomycetaceae bacterium]
MRCLIQLLRGTFIGIALLIMAGPAWASEPDAAYYHDGPLAGSLKSDKPLPIYVENSDHLWNRLFAAFYMRPSNLPSVKGGKRIQRIEGGDVIDFYGWSKTTYWSEPVVTARLNRLLDEYLEQGGSAMIDDRLRRSVLLRDMWAAYDYFIGQNIRRKGTVSDRATRDVLCRKLARVIRSLALPNQAIGMLPDTYAKALASGQFNTATPLNPKQNYLPTGLLTKPDEWVEIDFFQPDIHEDLSNRFITLHTRSYRARSYFRIFYRFPEGRQQLVQYLKLLDQEGIDWKRAAQNGFIFLKKDAPQIPVGTEVALVQFMMALNRELQPTPTRIVESIRMRNYVSTDGSEKEVTNTGHGMNVMEYTLKRQLLFDNLRAGGLRREPDNEELYRVIFQGDRDPDWGHDGRTVLFQQCVNCHMSPKATRTGVHSFASIVNMGGFDAGAQLGVAVPLSPEKSTTRGRRAAKWKTGHETYRRLLEHLGR